MISISEGLEGLGIAAMPTRGPAFVKAPIAKAPIVPKLAPSGGTSMPFTPIPKERFRPHPAPIPASPGPASAPMPTSPPSTPPQKPGNAPRKRQAKSGLRGRVKRLEDYIAGQAASGDRFVPMSAPTAAKSSPTPSGGFVAAPPGSGSIGFAPKPAATQASIAPSPESAITAENAVTSPGTSKSAMPLILAAGAGLLAIMALKG